MKTILYFDPARPDAPRRRLTLSDALASAFVRAGVAAASDPADAGSLSAGEALSNGTPTAITLEHGSPGLTRMTRLTVPLSVAQIAAAAGVAAGILEPIASGITPPPTPTLAALTLAAPSIAENAAAGTVVSGILGTTAGSTITLTDTAGGRFAVSGGNLVAGATSTDFETATSHQVTVRETLTGATNSPRDTQLTISVANVFEQPSLSALGLSATSFTIGTAASGAITGATTGSTIAASGLPSGLTINGPARTWAWSGSGSAASSTITLTETLADSANSPRASNVGVTVNAAGGETFTPMAANTTVAQFGDSITDLRAACKGTANHGMILDGMLGGRLQPLPGYNQGISGNTMTQMIARVQFVAGMKPGVVRFMGGINDLSQSRTLQQMIDDTQAIIDAIHNASPNTEIWLYATLSIEGISGPNQTVLDNLNAYKAGKEKLTGTKRIVYIPQPTGWNPTAGVHTFDKTHPNPAGAFLIALTAWNKVKDRIEAFDVLAQATGAVTGYGANGDASGNMAGTSGTKVNSSTGTCTGDVATAKRVTNATTATVACSKGTIGSDDCQIIDISGTVSTEGVVTFDATTQAVLATSGAPMGVGGLAEGLARIQVSNIAEDGPPVGFMNVGFTAGSLGNGMSSSSIGSGAGTGPTSVNVLDLVLRTVPVPLATAGAVSITPTMPFRLAAGAVNIRIKISRMRIRRVGLVAVTAPFYIGNDTIKGTTEQVRITGSFTVGGTITGFPGTYSYGGIEGVSATAGFTPTFYLDGVQAQQNGAWTFVIPAGSAGKVPTFKALPTNSLGSDTTTMATGSAIA